MREYAIGTDQDLRSALAPENIARLIDRGVERKFERGDCLFHRGDGGESVLLLLDGRVKVEAIPGNKTTYLPEPAAGVVSQLTDLIASMR